MVKLICSSTARHVIAAMIILVLSYLHAETSFDGLRCAYTNRTTFSPLPVHLVLFACSFIGDKRRWKLVPWYVYTYIYGMWWSNNHWRLHNSAFEMVPAAQRGSNPKPF